MEAIGQLTAARALYIREIRVQKRKYWREFLDDPANL